MWPLDVLSFGVAVFIWGFVGFSLMKQYRYATLVFDMLRIYPILILVSWIVAVISSFSWFEYATSILLIAILGFITLILLVFSIIWVRDYSSAAFKEFLEGIKSEEFSIISFDDYKKGLIDSEKVNVFLRHDVDISLPRTVNMAEIEKELGIQSTYFFRLHAEKYTFDEAKSIIQTLSDDGFRIGLHYETLTIAKGDRQKALELLKVDIQRLREITPVSVVAAHGQKQYKNREIWEDVDKTALQISSAYDMKFDMYLSDAGGKRLSAKDGKYLFDRIYEAKPGQIVQVLIHPDWWN